MNVEKALEEYNKLPYVEKRILQLKCFSKDGISKTDFLKIINKSDLKNAFGKQYNHSHLTPILENLCKKKLLQRDYSIDIVILHQLLLSAVSLQFATNNIQCISAILKENESLVDILKFSIYANHLEYFRSATKDINRHQQIIEYLSRHFVIAHLGEEWFNKLHPEIQYWLVAAKLYDLAFFKNSITPQAINLLRRNIDGKLAKWLIEPDIIIDLFLDYFFLSGDIKKIEYLVNITKLKPVKHHAILGVLKFLQGENTLALENFNIAIKALKDLSRKRNISLSGSYGIFYILALLQEDKLSNPDTNLQRTTTTATLQQILVILKNYGALETIYNKEQFALKYHNYGRIEFETSKYFNPYYEMSYKLLGILAEFLNGMIAVENQLDTVIPGGSDSASSIIDMVILFLVSYWTQSKLLNTDLYAVKLKSKEWVYAGVGEIAPLPNESNKALSTDLQDLQDNIVNDDKLISNPTIYQINFLQIVPIKQEWERALSSLSSYFSKGERGKSNNEQDKRLIWTLYPKRSRIEPLEQKKLANGTWSGGRAVSLHRLSENRKNFSYLSTHDIPVIDTIECYNNNYYRGYYKTEYEINAEKALLALINHPLIFDGDSKEHIELVKATPELIIKEGSKDYQIKLSAHSNTPTVSLQKDGINRYKVLEISVANLNLMKIIGSEGFSVPKKAKEQVLDLLQNAASAMSIRTEFDVSDIASTPGDATLVVQLTLVDDILKLKLYVRPFSGKGSYYKPGKGNKNIAAQIDNNYQSVIRDLDQEKKNVSHLLANCQTLSNQDSHDNEWKIDDLETGLEILYELNECKSKLSLIIEWPHGQSLSIDRELSFSDLKLNIVSHNQWFSFDGELEIDDAQVMKMQNLLEKLGQSKGRFIELNDKRFIALTASFAKRLEELNIAAKISDNSNTIHKLATPLLQEFIDQAKQVKTDKAWRGHVANLAKVEQYNPNLPTGLRAELRPYQIEGFKWLAKLSNLGFGACLADDMGLGKTVQTIALLLTQATHGPCLVVAPASVCYVWETECKRFAPSLNCVSITSSNDRESLVQNLDKMDVLICSYGLLYQIGEFLITKQFQIAVLDEAQAIKNFNTKRFKIITKLNAINRVALSGTPIENRTEELWNLFEFLNPGFLGSRQSFQAKYIKPIEVDKNIAVRNTLKRLIQPFVLRRMKNKVLDELPPKIEQTVFIEPSEEEKNFYEALRRESLERISNLSSASAAQKRFSVLAEITKLRRACCDSTLVDSDIKLPNSKLDIFDEIVNELKENNHRALVFSQYVGYLEIVGKRLDLNKISYQYLDGSSTQKQRQSSVDAFQSGEGDLFLISLKAGGVGLNLTAADYVIHLDPWWNPAIEDQASDRAHRIGQTRPVTIYRLVMKYSIEEKILKMHHDKRELAISLLSDSDKSASLNEDDLLALIKQEM